MSDYSDKRDSKKVWLAVLLAIFFGPFGLFYVSWLVALVFIGVYYGIHAVLPWPTFVKVTFWWGLPILSAWFFSPTYRQVALAKKLDSPEDVVISQVPEHNSSPSSTGVPSLPSTEAEKSVPGTPEKSLPQSHSDKSESEQVRREESSRESLPKEAHKASEKHDVATIDAKKLRKRIELHKESLAEEIQKLAEDAFNEAHDDEQIAATLPWREITVASLNKKTPTKAYLPKQVRLGDLFHRGLFGEKSDRYRHPAFLPLSRRTMLGVISYQGANKDSADRFIQQIILRMVCSMPVGAAQIHLIDLKTMGRAFSVLSALNPTIVPRAPSTADERIKFFRGLEERAIDIQRRCLLKHTWLCDANQANPDEAEPYHFIAISDFSNQLEEESIKSIGRLLSKQCGARCGIYFFISTDAETPEFSFPAYERGDSTISGFWESDWFGVKDSEFDNMPAGCLIDESQTGDFVDLKLLADPLPSHAADLIDWINISLKTKPKQKKVEVTVDDSRVWTSSAANGFTVPIGKNGREEVLFQFGNDSVVHHALIGGATGTGKTVLLHNIILNAADLYAPEDLQMILMDFKEGTEFACYERLPHVRVLSIASELHFGHNVFEWLVAERMRRAGLFKKAGAANLGDYLSKSGLKLPRIVVVMDEFQRILSDTSVGSQVSLLLDDIVRTGRSFGINLILSTQSLANVQLESSTLTSVGLRICMRLSEQEAARFLNYDNTLPTTFNRAGQAVYNDSEGRKEGNTEFQVGFIEVSDIPTRCVALRQRELDRYGKPVVDSVRVFHGEMPVDPVKRIPETRSGHLEAFIGEPLKLDAPPLPVVFEQKDGANLIAVGQSFDILNTLSNNLAVQFLQKPNPPDILVVDSFPLAKDRWIWGIERGVKFLTTPQSINEALDALVADLESRKLRETENFFTPKFLFLIEPQGSKAFPVSTTGEASPAALKVQSLLDQGPRHGIHVALMSTRLARTDKVLGNFGPLNLQPFSLRIAFKSEEAGNLIYDASTKTLGSYSGVISEESTGEITPFQIYDLITP